MRCMVVTPSPCVGGTYRATLTIGAGVHIIIRRDDSSQGLQPGVVVQGKYRVLEQLGTGSNGTTYAAMVLSGPQVRAPLGPNPSLQHVLVLISTSQTAAESRALVVAAADRFCAERRRAV